jgi:acyl-CoA synthetase (AMP-forming)/AMP-acid ligase II
MDARGYCTVEGRLKDMIIRGGENIYPRELEELLFKHPKVGEVGHWRSPRKMGRGGRRLHPAGARGSHRQGGAGGVHARVARPTQDAQTLVRLGCVPAHRIGQDSEIQAAGSLDQRRDDGDLAT